MVEQPLEQPTCSNEYGVATIQHLAKYDAGELAERTLLPLDRIAGWIDQAIIINEIKRNIVVTRGLGIGCASDVAALWFTDEPEKTNMLKSAGAKTTLGEEAFRSLARRFASDCAVRLLYEWRQGQKLPDAQPLADFPARFDQQIQRYDVVSPDGTTPLGVLHVKPQPQQQT